MGPPGCGKTEHAQRLADKFKVQYVKVAHLIKDHIRNEKDKAKAAELRALLESCKPFPNDFIINLVKSRLDKPDCRTNGWILDGCPTTTE
jgi:adenylate kinase family enzyme